MLDSLETLAMPSSDATDPLLECLITLTTKYNRTFSREALCAGLPLVNQFLTPQLFVRAAERAGLIAKIVKRQLHRIPKLVLPAVLLLKDNQACILHQIHDDQTLSVAFPETSQSISTKSLEEVAEVYSGYSIFIQPSRHFEGNDEKKGQEQSSSHWFWGTLLKYKRSYAEVGLAALFVNIFTLISPLFVMNVYDRVVPNNAQVTLWVLAIGVFIAFIFDLSLRILRGYLIDVCGKKADILMASRLFQHIMDMQLIHKPTSVGAFVNTLREFDTVRDFFTSATLTTLVDLPFICLFLFFIWYIGGALVLVPLAAIPIVLGTALLLELPLRKVVKQALQGTSQKNAILVEAIGGLETIKSLSAEGIMQHKWEQCIGATSHLGLRSRLLSASVVNIAHFAQQLVYVGTVIVGVYLIEAHDITLGSLIACNIIAGRTLAPLGQLASMLTRYHQAKIALRNLNKIMALTSEHQLQKRFLHQPSLKGEIHFKDVTFQYPKQPHKTLNNISCKIAVGERVAIIGRIGSGKTTLQKLLLGLYRPESGMITLDGIDMNQIDPIDIRRRIGYVPQDSLLFAGSVRDNITMGQPHSSDESILQAASIAGVDRIINKHPEGFNMPIVERGESLSGGQRQAIAIARAVLNNPPILLFDEPTSAMDENSEQELLRKLSTYLNNKTLILVTHKASLLTLVNRIIILDQGKIVLDGPKDQILKQIRLAAKPNAGATRS